MTSGGQGWSSNSLGKGLWILIASPLLSIATGSIIGAGAFAILSLTASGGSPSDLFRAYMASLLYSSLVTVPFGSVAGISAALIIIALGRGSHRGASLNRWLSTGGTLGAAVGLACPLFLLILGFRGNGESILSWILFYGITGGVSGVVVGVALGALAWREFGQRAEPRRAG